MKNPIDEVRELVSLSESILLNEGHMLYYLDDHVAVFSTGSLMGYEKIFTTKEARYIVSVITEHELYFSYYHREILPLYNYMAASLTYKIKREERLEDNTHYHLEDKVLDKIKNEISERLINNSKVFNDFDSVLKHVIELFQLNSVLVDGLVRLYNTIGSDGFYALEYSLIDNEDVIITPINGYSFYSPNVAKEFIEDPFARQTVLETPYVMLYAGEYGDLLALDKLCRFYRNTGIPILLIASSFGAQVYQMLAYLVSNNICKVYPVRMAIDGDRMLEIMHDIAYITGAEVIYPYGTWDLARCLGRCDGVLIKDGFCSIVPEESMRHKAELRATTLRQMAEKEVDIERKIFLNERAAKLMSRVAVVSVGGKHRLNREYQRDKFTRAFSYMQNTMKNNRVLNLKTAFRSIKDMTSISCILDIMRDMTNDKRYAGITSTYYPTNSLISVIDTLVRIARAVRSVLVM
jgi:hypothetical protein